MTGVRIQLITASAHASSEAAARFAADYALVHDWLRDYVSEPAAELGRTGAVCPFVPVAMREKSIEFVFRYDVTARDRDQARAALLAEIDDFDATAAPTGNAGSSLASRLIVMPYADRGGWRWLDQVYESLKDHAVSAHLMIGQFHPDCEERAVRNSNFRVSRAPIALLAIRRMAPHDVLFLHDARDWFRRYQDKFKSHMERGRVRDELMLKLYTDAVAKHGQSGEENDR